MTWLEDVRREIGILNKKIYLNNASSGPIPKPVYNRVCMVMEESYSEGEPWDEFLDTIPRFREIFSRFIGASRDEVAYIPGVTYGLETLISSIDLDRDSNIVISELNFPTTIVMAHSMARRGVVKEVRMVRDRGGYTDINEYERVIDDKTSLVIVDYVPWLTGYLEDLRYISSLAHDHGAYIVSDMFHAIGVIPVDVKELGVDAAVTGSYKWLMSLHGVGALYVNKDVMDELMPKYMGWLAIEDSVWDRRERGEDEFRRPFNLINFNYSRRASRFELGTPPIVPLIAFYESLKFLEEFKAPERFYTHTYKLVNRLMDGLMDMGYEILTSRERHASIVSFRHDDPHTLAADLYEEGVEVSARPGLIRVSPHFYNTMDDIEAFLELLGKKD